MLKNVKGIFTIQLNFVLISFITNATYFVCTFYGAIYVNVLFIVAYTQNYIHDENICILQKPRPLLI